jgi:hypothetical protein
MAGSVGVAAIGERLLDRVDRLAIELTELIRSTEPFYRAGGVVPLDDLRASVLDNLVHILSRLAGRPKAGLEPPRATGRRRAEQGVPLAEILHAYRIAGKFLWSAILGEAAATNSEPSSLLGAASDLWYIIDELSGEVTASYRDTVDERARRHQQTRHAMLDVLLGGDAGDGTRLWESVTALRLPRQGPYVVAAMRTLDPGVEPVPGIEDTLRRRGVPSAWRVQVADQVGVLVLSTRMSIDHVCALLAEITNETVGLSEVYENLETTPASVRQARIASRAASTTDAGPVRYEQIPVGVLLASAPEAAALVANAILGPVLALPEAECDSILTTLGVWFDDQGATSVAATRLHLHRNTVRYRLRRLEELTGRSLTEPTGIAQLYLALQAAKILRPASPRHVRSG